MVLRADALIVMWDRPPNFLLVDYYNRVNGSVFEVAAMANGLDYNRQSSGGETASAASPRRRMMMPVSIVMAIVATLFFGLFGEAL